MMIKPPCSLVPGDTIGICALSGAFDPGIFTQGISVLEGMGFRVYVPSGLSATKRYLAGEDQHRADIFHELAAMETVRAIMCARGGFGAMGVLPLLDFERLRGCAKPLVGFSDVTAALVTLGQRVHFPVVHGPVITSLATSFPMTNTSLYQVLTTPWHQVPDLTAEKGLTLTPGRARGLFYGGNLATLCHLCGTPFQPILENTILFLEEINEPPYKIDRMLTQMKLSGVFQGVRGVALGQFQNCGHEKILHEIFHEHLGHLPLLAGIPSGHGHVNVSLPMGVLWLWMPMNIGFPGQGRGVSMAIDTLMAAGIRQGVFPGGVLLISQGEQIVFHRAYGQQSLFTHDPVTLDTCFDLASLTKPLVTALAVATLVDRGALALDQPLGVLVDCGGHDDKKSITIDQLLRHTSGFPAHRPFYSLLAKMPREDRRPALRQLIMAEPLIHSPGARQIYSDLGYMMLAWIVESTARRRLDQFVDDFFFTPLGLDLFFRPLGECDVSPGQLKRFAATEQCPWRHRILTGEVHDDNAWAAGGVEGHAGLFGTAHAVGTLLFYMLTALQDRSIPRPQFPDSNTQYPAPTTQQHPQPSTQHPVSSTQTPVNSPPPPPPPTPIPGRVFRQFVRKELGRERVAGFDTPSPVSSSAGGGFPPGALGHLGYTGTSFWMDPDRSIIVVLLTNRVHPSRDNIKIRQFRPRLHDVVMERFKSDPNHPAIC